MHDNTNSTLRLMPFLNSKRPSKGNIHTLINVVGFNIYWFLCVSQNEFLLVLALGLLVAHFVTYGRAELASCMIVTALGIFVDYSLMRLDFFIFPDQHFPAWLGLLWVGFATTLIHTFHFLHHRLLLAGALGGIGGSTSYLSGLALGAVEFSLPVAHSFVVLFVVWTLLFPLLIFVAREVHRHAQSAR